MYVGVGGERGGGGQDGLPGRCGIGTVLRYRDGARVDGLRRGKKKRLYSVCPVLKLLKFFTSVLESFSQ